jgi:peroxiredoxin
MQLVELQETVAPLDEMAPYAISYDTQDVLATFAEANNITYPLLGDVGSAVIEELGLLNVDIVEERAYWGRDMTERHQRLPYPATFVLDEDGIIVRKFMERSHRNRPTGRMLAEDRGLLAPDHDADIVVSAETDGVAATAWVAAANYFPNQIFRIGVRVGVEDGLHLYVPPTDDGYTVLSVGLDAPEGVYWEPPELPEGRAFTVQGLDDAFSVVDGVIDLAVPVHIHEDVGDVTLAVVVRFQACSDTACLIPDEIRLQLPLTSRGRM